MIRAASTGPTPGSTSSADTSAVLTRTFPSAGAGPPEATTSGTTSCCPSVMGAARFSDARSAPGRAPPAATTASATRAPAGSETSPGNATLPDTCTVTIPPVVRGGAISICGAAEAAGHNRKAPAIPAIPMATAPTHERSMERDVAGRTPQGKTPLRSLQFPVSSHQEGGVVSRPSVTPLRIRPVPGTRYPAQAHARGIGHRESGIGDRRLETGDWRLETGDSLSRKHRAHGDEVEAGVDRYGAGEPSGAQAFIGEHQCQDEQERHRERRTGIDEVDTREPGAGDHHRPASPLGKQCRKEHARKA